MKKQKKEQLINILNFKLNEKKKHIYSCDNMIKVLQENKNELLKTLKQEKYTKYEDENIQFALPSYIYSVQKRIAKVEESLNKILQERKKLSIQLKEFYNKQKRKELYLDNIIQKEEKEKKKKSNNLNIENITIRINKK